MSGKKIILPILTAWIIMITANLSAQNERMIKWQSVYGAGGYIIEIKNSDGKVIVEKELLSTSYDISRLDSGKYSYRVTTLNKLKQRGRSTSWIGFTVEKAVIPEIKSVSHKILAWSFDNPGVAVKGISFDNSTKIFLRKGTVNIKTETEFISDSELNFKYNPDTDKAGVYDLVALNEAGFEAVLKNAIEIKAPDIPVIESVSGEKIFHSTRTEIIMRGLNLGIDTIPVIEDDTGKRLQVKYRNVSDNEIIVTFDLLPADKGRYSVYVLKNDIFKSEKNFRLEVADPVIDDKIAQVKDSGTDNKNKDKNEVGESTGDIYLGLAWEYNMPIGVWADELSASPAGLHIYFAYQLKGFSFLNSIPVINKLEFEAKAGYSVFDLVSGTSKEYYSIIDMTAGFNCPLPVSLFSGRIFPLLNIDSGIAYSTASIYNYTGTNVYTSYDPVIYAGISFRYRQGMFFSDISCGWQRIFYVSNPMDEIRVSLRAGVVF